MSGKHWMKHKKTFPHRWFHVCYGAMIFSIGFVIYCHQSGFIAENVAEDRKEYEALGETAGIELEVAHYMGNAIAGFMAGCLLAWCVRRLIWGAPKYSY